MSERAWHEFLSAAAGGRIIDDSHAPAHWTLADRAGNRVCICAWPDESDRNLSDEPALDDSDDGR